MSGGGALSARGSLVPGKVKKQFGAHANLDDIKNRIRDSRDVAKNQIGQMRASSSLSSLKNAKDEKLDNIIKRSQKLRERRQELQRKSQCSMGSLN